MFIAAALRWACCGGNSSYSPKDEWVNKFWYICTIEYYSAFKKVVNPVIYYCMDEPLGLLRNSVTKDKCSHFI